MEIDFNKGNGLIPAIIQDALTHEVLMLGYMKRGAVGIIDYPLNKVI